MSGGAISPVAGSRTYTGWQQQLAPLGGDRAGHDKAWTQRTGDDQPHRKIVPDLGSAPHRHQVAGLVPVETAVEYEYRKRHVHDRDDEYARQLPGLELPE